MIEVLYPSKKQSEIKALESELHDLIRLQGNVVKAVETVCYKHEIGRSDQVKFFTECQIDTFVIVLLWTDPQRAPLNLRLIFGHLSTLRIKQKILSDMTKSI